MSDGWTIWTLVVQPLLDNEPDTGRRMRILCFARELEARRAYREALFQEMRMIDVDYTSDRALRDMIDADPEYYLDLLEDRGAALVRLREVHVENAELLEPRLIERLPRATPQPRERDAPPALDAASYGAFS